MGIVYSANDTRLNRPVALKMILDSGDDEDSRKRFLREAQAAARVTHPNICRLYDIGEVDGRPFLVMELLEGESMSVRLGRGPMPLAEALQVTLSVLSALAALHRSSIVHRDLKPSNVFLSTQGVKLLDFGLAKPVVASLRRRADADRADRAWSDRRDAAILVAGAGDRKAGGRTIGSVRGRRDSFRGVSWQTGFRG